MSEYISIHTLRAEGDKIVLYILILQKLFQSTPSGRRVTQAAAALQEIEKISIHTLRAEGDLNP